MPALPKTPSWLRAGVDGRPVGVDREANAIRGFVVAQEGLFKTPGRGQFDKASIREIVSLMKREPAGLKSHFAHPTLSDDGLGRYLGRARNPRRDMLTRKNEQGEESIDIVRADLFFDPSASSTPNGNLSQYIMDLAASDPDALSSSLVLQADKEQLLDNNGWPRRDETGQELPPIWRPTRLHATDIVDTGDAVDGLLSADNMPEDIVRRAAEMLDRQFGNASREVIECRCKAWLSRYLDVRFGVPKKCDPEIVKRILQNRQAIRQ